jgi:CDP-glycerol glycerophosphotransferase (TagB/SpsB family)
VAFVESADASSCLAAADLMVTDHSSVGFEYLVLDRPLVVYDAPDLAAAARINPEKIELLRSAAAVVRTTQELSMVVCQELTVPGRLSRERRRVAGEMFHAPGTATDRAVALVCELLDRQRSVSTVEAAAAASLPGGAS